MIFLGANIKSLRKGVGLTQGQLAEKLGVNANTVSNYEKGNSSPGFDTLELLIKILDINAQDLLYKNLSDENSKKCEQTDCTHQRSQNCTEKKAPKNVSNDDKRKVQKTSSNESDDQPGVKYELKLRGFGIAADAKAAYKTARDFPLRTDRPVDMQQVPLYNLNASAGLVGLFIDTSNQIPVDYISIPGLPRCDGAVHVCGDSMYPLLKSGDIVIYKEVNDIINNIFWGEMYMVSFDIDGEEYITIKYVKRSDDPESIRLVSYNTHHGDQDISLSRVRAMALIKASVRFNTMG